MIYEAHITCFLVDAATATVVADELEWKTSQIARDITLGDDTYFYLTRHQRDVFALHEELRIAVAMLRMHKVEGSA
jgi:hypothetical protein